MKLRPQWDKFLPRVLCNAPYEANKEKLSFLMFGVDLQLTTEAALLSPNSMDLSNISNYWEELLSSVRKLVATTLHEEQKRSKEQ